MRSDSQIQQVFTHLASIVVTRFSGVQRACLAATCVFSAAHIISIPAIAWAKPQQETPVIVTQAGVPKKAVTLEQIRNLTRQLESDALADRDQAEQQLVELGPTALQFLPSVTPQTSGELKIRLQRIRQQLQSLQLETHFQASKLTLQGKMTVKEILSVIKQQTGNIIILQAGEQIADMTTTVDWNQTEFWQAIDGLCLQYELRPLAFTTTNSELVLGPSYGDDQLKPSITGPFRMDVSGVESQRLFGSQLDGLTRVSLIFSWEPRLEPIFMQIPMNSLVATSGDGQEFRAANPNATPEIRLNIGGCSAQVDLQLDRIDRQHKQLASLSGQLVVSVPGERHRYEFSKFTTGKRQTQRYGDVAVTLEGAQRNGRVYEMRMFVEFGDSQGALESFRGWILSNRAYVLDSKENTLENVGFQTYGASDNGVGVSYMFQLNQDPDSYRLIYESPSSIQRQTIQYSLENIPLP